MKGSYGTKVCGGLRWIKLAQTRVLPLIACCLHLSPASQLEAVVARLLWLTRQDATNRVLVFSTWKDMLELVRCACLAQ